MHSAVNFTMQLSSELNLRWQWVQFGFASRYVINTRIVIGMTINQGGWHS